MRTNLYLVTTHNNNVVPVTGPAGAPEDDAAFAKVLDVAYQRIRQQRGAVDDCHGPLNEWAVEAVR